MSLLESAHYAAEDRAEALCAAGERIAGDADKVYELVYNDQEATDSPIMDGGWTAELLIALRDSKPILNALCRGYTLEEAMARCTGADAFRALLIDADMADSWIAKLIDEAAAEAVDAEDEA